MFEWSGGHFLQILCIDVIIEEPCLSEFFMAPTAVYWALVLRLLLEREVEKERRLPTPWPHPEPSPAVTSSEHRVYSRHVSHVL